MSVEYTFKQGTLAGTTPQASIQSIVEKVGPIASNKIIFSLGFNSASLLAHERPVNPAPIMTHLASKSVVSLLLGSLG